MTPLVLSLLAGAVPTLAQDAQPSPFAQRPDGLTDHLGMVKDVNAAPQPGAWDLHVTPEQVLAIAADDSGERAALAQLSARNIPLMDGATPNYHVYKGVPIAMELDPSRVALLVTDDIAEQDAVGVALRALGLENDPVALNAPHTTFRRWVYVTLPAPMVDALAVRKALDQALDADGVAFASPVFRSYAVRDGTMVVTPDVMARVKPDLRGDHLRVIADRAAGFEVTQARLGTLAGAVMMRASSRNGFDVLGQANALAADGAFSWAEPDFLASVEFGLTPDDPRFDEQWGMSQGNDEDIDAPAAWDISLGRSTVRALVMDVGCQTNHPDLNWGDGRDFTTGVVGGVGTGAPGNACENHGTAVAGCISALTDNGVGVAGISGLSPSYNAKMADQANNPGSCSNSFSNYNASWVVNALAWGAANGCRTSNASFAAGFSQAIADEYEDTYLNSDMLHFAAAGNNGSSTISFPSSAPFVISCAALNSAGNRASFSNYGTGLDISAPGVDVLTTDRTGASGYNGTDYASVDGTSFASPYAAGIATLFYSTHPHASQAQGLVAMFLGAVDMGANGRDDDFGYGFANAYNTLTYFSPSHDFCADAREITTNTYDPAVISTLWAVNRVREPSESCESGGAGTTASVFYRFTAPNTGIMNINTNGSTYDTVLSVHSGCGLSFNGIYLPPAQIACDDDSGDGLDSLLTGVPIEIGDSVIIKVSKYGTTPGGGDLDFNFEFVPVAPANNACSNATALPTNYGTFTDNDLDTEFATAPTCDGNPDGCGSNPNSNSVWYRFAPAVDGQITIATAGSTYDTVVSVRSGFCPFSINGNCINPASLICDDDGGEGLTSLITGFEVTAGTVYFVKVANFASPGPGVLDFFFEFSPPPAQCDPDVNCDGSPDQGDVACMILAVAGNVSCICQDPDFNQDGSADQGDVAALIQVVAGQPCP